MNLREHVILGGGAALALSPVLGPPESLVFWASSVLIDADHYWEYLWHNGFRNWDPAKTFAFHRSLFQKIHHREFLALNLLHTIEWLSFVYLMGIWLESGAILAAFWGMVFHLGLDLARLAWCRATFKRALSVIEYWIRRRGLVKRGLDPDQMFQEALVEIGVFHPVRTAAIEAEAGKSPSAWTS